MTETAHLDTFARDHLPPRDQWPEFLYDLPELQYPAALNCAAELLDATVAKGLGERAAIVTPQRRMTYAELLADANRIANVLLSDLGLVPGNRVLLRGFNNDVMAACWLGVVKAGCVVVTTMPLLRAKELVDVITAAEITHAICDARLVDELHAARPSCATLTTVVLSHLQGPGSLAARMKKQRDTFDNVETASDDVCMIAFTSGTTGRPKGTMHFHRDVLAICDTFPPSSFAPTPDDVFVGTPPLAFTYGLGGALLFPLRAGASTVLLEKPAPDALLDAIAEFGATSSYPARKPASCSASNSGTTAAEAKAWNSSSRRNGRARRVSGAGDHRPGCRDLRKRADRLDAEGRFSASDIAGQVRQALSNVAEPSLAEAGALPSTSRG